MKYQHNCYAGTTKGTESIRAPKRCARIHVPMAMAIVLTAAMFSPPSSAGTPEKKASMDIVAANGEASASVDTRRFGGAAINIMSKALTYAASELRNGLADYRQLLIRDNATSDHIASIDY